MSENSFRKIHETDYKNRLGWQLLNAMLFILSNHRTFYNFFYHESELIFSLSGSEKKLTDFATPVLLVVQLILVVELVGTSVGLKDVEVPPGWELELIFRTAGWS